MADTSLVVETGQAKHCPAQLTRFQTALDLKEELESGCRPGTLINIEFFADWK
jgi:hypothetical protein